MRILGPRMANRKLNNIVEVKPRDTALTVGSLFSGIGGLDLGFVRAGFKVKWCVERDRHARAVLEEKLPNDKIYPDITEVCGKELLKNHGQVEVICGGFPCQDLSVAGKRAGLQGERSGLFYRAMQVIRELSPSVVLLENVPGLLTSNRGRDFAALIREMEQGWGCQEVAWRVLDSQYFGVPQRRRRVFIVGSARVRCASHILALEDGGAGNPRACTPARSGPAGEVQGFTPSQFGNYREGVGTLRANGGDLGGGSETLVAEKRWVSVRDSSGQSLRKRKRVVRKLTPSECERLQGFPEDWTKVEGISKTVRYRQLGNAVTVNVAEWLARRAAKVLRSDS